MVAALSFWDYSPQVDRHLPGSGEAYKASGRCFSVAAGRISFCHGLKGPAISLDTACSSSLSAVHLAQRIVLGGQSFQALVTAALLTMDPATISMLTAAAMLAPDGRCKTMDAAADGYVRGEAAVTLGLSLAHEAVIAELPPLAVVAGSAINQDGRSSSLTAPHGPSQQEVMRLALHNAQMGTEQVHALEMHGTGTALGDPIEVGAAAAVFGVAARAAPLEFSAAKSHMGHAEPAAGAVGIARAVFRLGSGCALGMLHLTTVNPYVASTLDQTEMVAFLPRGPSAVGAPGVQAAVGISGFAFQGTNAHVILSQPSAQQALPAVPSSLTFRSVRHWFAPPAHRLAQCTGVPARGWVETQCTFGSPGLSYLWEHVVKGRSLLPGTALFETAYAAVAVAHEGGPAAQPALVAAAIEAPLLLKAPLQAPVVHCTVQLSTGMLQVSSAAAATSVHLRAAAARVSAPRKPAAPTGPGRRVAALLGVVAPLPVHHTQWQGAAAGCVASQPASPVDGYSGHPAQLDAATHPGALLDLDSGSQPRVPVALECYLPSGHPSSALAAEWRAGAGNAELTAGGLRHSTFTLYSASGASTSLHSLCSKLLGIAPAAPHSIENSQYAQACFMYETAWQVAEAAVSAASTANQVALVAEFQRKQIDLSLARVTALAGSAALHQQAVQVFGAVCSVLQSMPRATHAGLSAAVANCVAGLQGSGGEGGESTAIGGIAGLLAVAALEEPSWQLHLQPRASGGALSLQPRLLPTLQQSAAAAAHMLGYVPSCGGLTLVTGGLSGLGLLTASWLIAGGSSNPSVGGVALISRSGRQTAGGKDAAWLLAAQQPVHMIQCDMGSTADACASLERLTCTAPVTTILHAAGVLADRMLSGQTLGAAFQVFGPKVAGLTCLLSRTSHQPLTSLQLFSSISALLGNPGQANYGAANAVLDAAALHLQRTGLVATSVQWGPWAQAGMAVQTPQLIARLQRQGLGAVQPAHGLAVLAAVLAPHSAVQSSCTFAASPLHWDNILKAKQHASPLYLEFAAPSAPSVDRGHARTSLTHHAAEVQAPAPAVDLEQRVLGLVASVLGVAVEASQPLMEAGLDSLGAVDLRNALGAAFGVDLPATVTFDYPSAAELSKLIARKAMPATAPSVPPAAAWASGAGGSRAAMWQQRYMKSSAAAPAAGESEIVAAVLTVTGQVLGCEIEVTQPFMEVRLNPCSVGNSA